MKIDLPKTSFKPGETVCGLASWEIGDKALVELLWSTLGRGEPETAVVAHASLAAPGPFSLPTPLSPWSVSGKLLSIKWSVRLTVGELKIMTDFTLSPTGQPYPLSQP